MRFTTVASIFASAMLLAFTASAQYGTDTSGQGGSGYYGGYEDPNAGGTGGGYGAGYGGYQDPAVGYQPQPEPAVQPQPTQPAAGAAAGYDYSTDEEDSGEVYRGFELGINWHGGRKVFFEPGWNFGRGGIYLLFGMDYYKSHWEAKTHDANLGLVDIDDPPGGPTTGSDGLPGVSGAGDHEDWAEEIQMDMGMFTYDIGVAGRVYLLDSLKARVPALYMELGLGWHGAAAKNEVDWSYLGDPDQIGNVDGDSDGDRDGNDVLALQTATNYMWGRIAEDEAEDMEQREDYFWMNVGIGAEYVFPGGFGIGGEVGLYLHYNNEWKEKSMFGYDDQITNVDDNVPADFAWEYYQVNYTGYEVGFGIYYNLSLRYHF